LRLLAAVAPAADVKACANKMSAALLQNDDNIGIYEMGLSAVLGAAPPHVAADLAAKLAPDLVAGMRRDNSKNSSTSNNNAPRLIVSCMVLLKDVLRLSGGAAALRSAQADMLEALLGVLHSPSTAVRSGAIACLGVLAEHLDATLLGMLADTLLTQIDHRDDDGSDGGNPSNRGEGKEVDVNTSIQAFSVVSKNVGHRLGGSLERIVPLFLSVLGEPEDIAEDAATDAKCLIKENILVALRRVVDHCPGQVNTFMDDILNTMFGFMRFDPNFCEDNGGNDDDDYDADNNDQDHAQSADSEDDTGSMYSGSDSDDDSATDDSDDDDSDDDDTDEDASWKVRRAAVRVIRSFISSRPDLLSTMYARCTGLAGDSGSGPLVARFLERNAVVRVEVIMCVRDLMRASSERHTEIRARGGSIKAGGVSMLRGASAGTASRARALLRQRSDYRVLADKSHSIMGVVERMLRGSIIVDASPSSEQKSSARKGKKKTKTKTKAVWISARVRNELWKMLREWLFAIGAETASRDSWDETTEAVLPLVPYVVASLDPAASMPGMRGRGDMDSAESDAKIGAISFLTALVQSHGKDAMRPCLPRIVAHVEAFARSNVFKVRGEAMSFVSAVARSGMLSSPTTDPALPSRLFAVCANCLNDTEATVKGIALLSASLMLSHVGADLEADSCAAFWSALVPQIAVSSSTGEAAMAAVRRGAKGDNALVGLTQTTCMAVFRALAAIVLSPQSATSAQRQALATTNALLRGVYRGGSADGQPLMLAGADAVELVLATAVAVVSPAKSQTVGEGKAEAMMTDDGAQRLLALDIFTTILSNQDRIFGSRAFFGKKAHASTCQAVINACVGMACRDQVSDDQISVVDSIASCIRACVEAGIIADAVVLSERLQHEATRPKMIAGSADVMSALPANAAASLSALLLAAKATSNADFEMLMGSLEAKLSQKDTPPRSRELALLVLGEVGRALDISARAVFQRDGGAAMASLGAREQDERVAAALCVGSVASLNVAAMLPAVLEKCQTSGPDGLRVSALAALKRMIVLCFAALSEGKSSTATAARLSVDDIGMILDVLVQCIASSKDDAGICAAAADCWGRLATLDTDDGECVRVISRTLQDSITWNATSLADSDAATDSAGKTMFSASVIALTVLVDNAPSSPAASDALSADSGVLVRVIDMMGTQKENAPLRIRILALFRVLLRRRCDVVVHLLEGDGGDDGGLLPAIFECAQYSRKEKVDHGAFTMIIDHGDALRLGALNSMRELLVFARSQIKESFGSFIDTVAKCAGDANEDVRQAAHRILETLCVMAPADIQTHLGSILEGMQKIDLKVRSRGKVKVVKVLGDSRDATRISCVSVWWKGIMTFWGRGARGNVLEHEN
jgi:hypothetical protein